eukprot:scaffold2035_cov53-Attheya_sp.AAC.1
MTTSSNVFGSYHGGEEAEDYFLGPNLGNGTSPQGNNRTRTTLGIIDSSSHQKRSNSFDAENSARKSRSEQWAVPLTIALLALSVETAMTVLMRTTATTSSESSLAPPRAIWTSAVKPIALFYVSTKARNALEALRSVVLKAAKVLLMELFLILCFAAVACRMYSNYESFQTLPRAFLSLFELSTTVVNPSIWMPMYQDSRSAAFFFVPFVVTSVFYLHSLVLSVVFKTYINAVSHIRNRKGMDAEDNLRLAFLAMTSSRNNSSDGIISNTVPLERVRRVLQVLRPHYGPRKIHALIEIVDPALEGRIKYDSFRAKLPRALTISLRTAQRSTEFSLLCEIFAATVAIANFLFVIIVSSPALDLLSRGSTIVRVGAFITVMATAELIMRLKLFRNVIGSTTRFNHIFDGLAAVASITSFCGLYIHLNVDESEVMLIGRAIDMIRVMRFFDIFRDIEFTCLPIWALHCGETLYMWAFMVLVVNDWHAIAQVFLLADRCSSCVIVYTFFISSNLFSVSILLNILTAFFVGAFVTDNESKTSNGGGSLDANSNPVSLRASTRGLKRVAVMTEDDESSDSSDLDNDNASQFQIYERQGFEKIMQTVAGGSDSDGEYAKQVCDVLEIFEGLTPGREKVGYLVCCQHSLNRFGNRRFESMLGDLLHEVVNEMHSEIMELGRSGNKHSEETVELVRQFPHVKDPTKALEVSARLLRRKPPVSIFISRITQPKKDTMDTTPE